MAGTRFGVAALAVVLLAGCGSPRDTPSAALDFARMDTPAELYRATDLLLDVTVLSAPAVARADEQASADPLLTTDAIVEARVNAIVQARPARRAR